MWGRDLQEGGVWKEKGVHPGEPGAMTVPNTQCQTLWCMRARLCYLGEVTRDLGYDPETSLQVLQPPTPRQDRTSQGLC